MPELEAWARDHQGQTGEVKDIAIVIPYKQTQKTKSNLEITPFAGLTELIDYPETGFWKYLKNRDIDPTIFPSFWLHRTNTGRAASSDPNGQNFPKRGPLAKAYRKIFIPREGFTFIESDLSQAELRIAAWMANEREMIRIYSEGGDIHSSTAAATMGISEAMFAAGLHDSETRLVDVVNEWPGAGQYLRQHKRSEWDEITVDKFCGYKRFAAKAVFRSLEDQALLP